MSNFMGPMAPPPAAQPQPQALDFKTDPNQRQRFRQFMRDRVSPNFGQAPAMMPNGIGTTMPTPQMAMPQMPMTSQPPMMPSMAPGAGIDVFSPQYMNQPAAPMGFAGGGSVPPREANIRGQYHELSYITPDEADILMALGGSGEAGPMGIPQYGYGDDDGSGGYGDGDSDTGGMGSGDSDTGGGGGGGGNDDPGSDPGDFEVNTNTPKGSEPDDPFAGEEGDDFGSGNYGNDDGSFNPYDFVDYGETALDKAIATTNAINTANQQRFNNLDQRLAQTQLDPMGTLTKNEILDFDAGPVVGDIEVNSIGGVNTGASKGTSSNTDLLGGIDDLLNSLDKTISKVSGPTASEINALENARNAATSTQTPTVVGNSDAETYDPDFDQATIDALQDIGVDQSVIDSNKRGSSQSGLESEGVLGALGIGSGKAYTGGVNKRFGTATGPGRLSTVTAEEMEALRTGNAVQRQIYNQLAGIKSAGPVLSQYEPINTGLVDTIFGMTNKPSSAIEVFRAPITEQQGFKSVNTGNFKEGISGVTGEGNTPGFMGGIMQMFGIDPIVYTGDSRFDPNRPQDDFGGDDDNVLLPLAPEEVVPESTDPNQMGGIGAPGTPIAAGPVLVPSTRTSAPFSGQMPVGYGTPQTGQINPYSLAEMQRYQQMLARLGQSKSPIGLANGGSVLDAAAGKFLESLTAA